MTDPHPPLGTRGLIERLHRIVSRVPQYPAVGDLDRTLTFEELASAATATAARMIEMDLPPGGVAVAADDAVQFTIGIVSAAAAGRPCVIPPGGLSADALRSYAAHARTVAFIGERDEQRVASGLTIVETMEPGASHGSDNSLAAVLDSDLAARIDWSPVVAYTGTSGSTGDPKLVAHRTATAWGRPLSPIGQPWTQIHSATNLSASGAFRNRVLVALLSGSRFTGFPLNRHPPSELLSRLLKDGVTHLSCTPSVLRRLHAAAKGRIVLDSVEEFASVGEVLQWSDVRRARELCGPQVTVLNRFGSTEAGIVTGRYVRPDEPIADGPLSVGHPTPGREVWIKGDDGNPVPVGEVGRIVIDGIFATVGADLENLGDGRSRFVSQDLGRLDAEGALWFEGRADRMVKIAGTRVEPAGVEDVLRDIPGVLDAAVLPVEVAPAEYRLVAHIVVGDVAPDVAVLRRTAAERIVDIAVPVRFHLRSEPFPLLPSGKIDRRRLESKQPV